MSDPAHEATDAIIKEIEKRLTKEYQQAIDELEKKIAEYTKAFATKDKIWQKWVEEGKKTQEEYTQWKIGQLAIGERWEQLKETLAEDMANANEIAHSTVEGYMPKVYAINHDYGVYEVETGLALDTSYTLYSREAAEAILRGTTFYHGPGKKVRMEKAVQWNKTQVESVMLQSIYQGESIPKIATRLANEVGETNRKAAIRNARTMATAVQNKGRVDSYIRAQNMGIGLEQMWVATLDNRTRHSHRMLDGESQPVGGTFSNGCRYPGDPQGPAKEVWNCRCTLIANLEGFEHDLTDLSLRNTNHMEGMSYEEWREGKAESRPIDYQDKAAESFRKWYTLEYMGKI